MLLFNTLQYRLHIFIYSFQIANKYIYSNIYIEDEKYVTCFKNEEFV